MALQLGEVGGGVRNGTIDGLKFVSASAIVLLHVAGTALYAYDSPALRFTTSVCYAALFFFFSVSGYFHGPIGCRGPAWLRTRLIRLAIPYAAWSGVYLAWGAFTGRAKMPLWNIVFFGGAEELLWFLPMLIICAVLAELFIHSARQRLWFILVFGVLAAVTVLAAEFAFYQPLGVRQFILGARWPLAYALGMQVRATNEPGLNKGWSPSVAVGSLLFVGLLGILSNTMYPIRLSGFLETAAYLLFATTLLLSAHAGFRWYGIQALAPLGPYLLGIYASHYLWLEICVKRIPATALPIGQWVLVLWLLVLGLASLNTLALRGSRFTRVFVS